MRARLSHGLFGVALSLVVAAACGYDPNPASGTLMCGPQSSCPDNYSCMSGRCWRNAAGGTGGGGGSPTDKFVGTWAFDAANTTRTRACNDGSGETMHPYADAFDVAAGAGGALTADFYCVWNLDLTMGGTTTAIRSGQSCSHPDATDPTINFTWHGEAFTFMTTNGTTGTAQISLPYDYTTLTGSGSCTMHFNGPVTKQ